MVVGGGGGGVCRTESGHDLHRMRTGSSFGMRMSADDENFSFGPNGSTRGSSGTRRKSRADGLGGGTEAVS